MKKIAFILLVGVAAAVQADGQRCIGMKPDAARLKCFDREVKPAKAEADSASDRRARNSANSDSACYTGPRGGRYRVVNGRKRYDC
jgi:hypothetical protein